MGAAYLRLLAVWYGCNSLSSRPMQYATKSTARPCVREAHGLDPKGNDEAHRLDPKENTHQGA